MPGRSWHKHQTRTLCSNGPGHVRRSCRISTRRCHRSRCGFSTRAGKKSRGLLPTARYLALQGQGLSHGQLPLKYIGQLKIDPQKLGDKAQGTVTLTYTNFKVNAGSAAAGFGPEASRALE